MLNNLLAVFIGGGLGATLRYLLTMMYTKYFGLAILGTFSANMIGCFIIGFVYAITMQKVGVLPNPLKIFITVGFLGGLTTFSTFNVEVFEFLRNGERILQGFGYLIISCALGLLLTFLGALFSKLF